MIEFHELVFEPLDKVSGVKTGDFSCGNPTINTYLHTHYLSHMDHRNRIASTTIISYQDKAVAYFTSRCTQIQVGAEEANALGLGSNNLFVPAIEIKFLAVDEDYQGQGVGKSVIAYIIADIQELSERHACRFIFLWSVPTVQALAFYSKRFFEDTGNINADGLHLMIFQVAEEIELEEY